ncbi:MAG: rod shape-determining protein MreD [Candidatus Obscuribacterales bacterium]|nr:rod shape-determining protein MreD [Steroidobacteraceae bacterium]
MIGDGQRSGGRMFFSAVAGLLLAIVPLPHWLNSLRPNFLLLFVIYWSLTSPHIAGLTFAWLCGFGIDIVQGLVLGQHAFAFLAVSYFTHRVQLRMRIFPVWQQATTVMLLLFVYQFIVFWIDGIIGKPVTSWQRWLPVLTGALLWPLLVAALDTWNRRRR